MKGVKLSIVTACLNDLQGLQKTCASIDQQRIKSFEHIIVARNLSIADTKLIFKNKKIERKLILNKDKSLYNAMNIGLKLACGSYIYFLNSGDYLNTNNFLKLLGKRMNVQKCVGFKTIQSFGNDNYVRIPRISTKRTYNIAHQGFIAPISKNKKLRIYFDEKKLVNSDAFWIKDCVNQYGVDFLMTKPLAVFNLGGVSNNPSSKTIMLYLQSKVFSQIPIEIIKFLFKKIFGITNLFRILAFYRGYTKL